MVPKNPKNLMNLIKTDDESKLAELIGCLSTDDSLTTYEYIHAEDDEVKGGRSKDSKKIVQMGSVKCCKKSQTS
ncbi:6972_t:CDS:2 [Racocetra persica]|uniref:6972_t:CDS:1 n=1 Tax=Racocetra persica TaxID=160502 RepID=A0ACA9NN80_9GLOM|nr:6972_t:CDS:2 [Racocetra persica]